MEDCSEFDLIGRILDGESRLYEYFIRNYNQGLFRTGMSILNDDTEVEDAMQAMGRGFETEYISNTTKAELYQKRYEQYKKFGSYVEDLTINH